ncbi:MAG: hypothetical protein ACK41Q_04710 [Candidatus Brocadia sp.]
MLKNMIDLTIKGPIIRITTTLLTTIDLTTIIIPPITIDIIIIDGVAVII